MIEAERIATKIDLLTERKELIIRETDFKIAMLEDQLKKLIIYRFKNKKPISTDVKNRNSTYYKWDRANF